MQPVDRVRAGFTLVELLLAIALGALLSGVAVLRCSALAVELKHLEL